MDKRLRVGEDSPHFRDGKTISHGYVVLTSKVWGANRGRYEHRVIMENILKRPLLKTEIVHHINGNTTDNRPENLEILTRLEHNRTHGGGKLMVCSICGREKWYSPKMQMRLKTDGEDYRCRICATTIRYEKTCKRCGSIFHGGMPARFCPNCTTKARGASRKWWE